MQQWNRCKIVFVVQDDYVGFRMEFTVHHFYVPRLISFVSVHVRGW